MDKIKETYETASWIFRELITLREFRNMIKSLSKSGKMGYVEEEDCHCFCCGTHTSKPIIKS